MITMEAKQLLIPTARCFHIAYGDHGVRLWGSNAYHNADSIASGIIDLGKPPLTTIEHGAAADPAAGALDLPQGPVEIVGRDPGNQTPGGGCHVRSELTDQTRRLKASAARIDRPAENRFVE